MHDTPPNTHFQFYDQHVCFCTQIFALGFETCSSEWSHQEMKSPTSDLLSCPPPSFLHYLSQPPVLPYLHPLSLLLNHFISINCTLSNQLVVLFSPTPAFGDERKTQPSSTGTISWIDEAVLSCFFSSFPPFYEFFLSSSEKRGMKPCSNLSSVYPQCIWLSSSFWDFQRCTIITADYKSEK